MTQNSLSERALLKFGPYKDHLGAKSVWCETSNFGNDLYWIAEWPDGAQHALVARECIPAGGISDELLQKMTDHAVAALRAWHAPTS